MIMSFSVYIMIFGYMTIVFVVNMKNIEGDKNERKRNIRIR